MPPALTYAPPALPQYRRGVFFAALLLTASVFPLIWMGGLVTSHQAGLSVPDWPNSYGYNMFLFPPSQWVGGILYEHTHRLLGTLSGFLAVVLVLMAWGPARTPGRRFGWSMAAGLLWLTAAAATIVAMAARREPWFPPGLTRALPHAAVGLASLAAVATAAVLCRTREPRRWVRWLTIGVLTAVCTQGALGGLRVVWVDVDFAIVHGCFAQAFFCLAAFTTLATSRWWHAADASLGAHARVPNDATAQAVASVRPLSSDRLRPGHAALRPVARLALITALVIFCQLVAGALMRHYHAGLAIPGVLVYGRVLPPLDGASVESINAWRAWQADLQPTTLRDLWLHYAHRVGACVVTGFVVATLWRVFQNPDAPRAARRAAAILGTLLVTQVTLGVLTVYLRKPADVASLHVAVGALTLMTSSVLAGVLTRRSGWRTALAVEAAPAGRLVTA